MSQIRELLVEELLDLVHAEKQLIAALPQMADAANDAKLKENFQKHLLQTKSQLSRLEEVLTGLGEEIESKPCKAMMGLIEEGKDCIKEGKEKGPLAADLGLIACAQKIEHYEISAYGTAKALARQIGEFEVADLLSHSLGEEEAADALLTMNAKPLLQEALIEDFEGDDEELDEDGEEAITRSRGRSSSSVSG